MIGALQLECVGLLIVLALLKTIGPVLLVGIEIPLAQLQNKYDWTTCLTIVDFVRL